MSWDQNGNPTERSTMNRFPELFEPLTPPPAWSPFKSNDFGRKASKWQTHSPRIRFLTKTVLVLALTAIAYNFSYFLPVGSRIAFPPANDPVQDTTERNNWLWKDFARHDGLTKGSRHFGICSDANICEDETPSMTRYRGDKYLGHQKSRMVSCLGPRGIPLNESIDDAVWAYPGKAKGAVDPSMGSYEASGLDGDISFDRIGRYQAYGIGQFDVTDGRKGSADVEWDTVSWGRLQELCVDANKHRFHLGKDQADKSVLQFSSRCRPPQVDEPSPSFDALTSVKRTAILIRVWTDARWSADVVINIRAMIMEASIASGGKYQVFILLHVRDESVALFAGENQPEETIRRHVPPEFHSITIAWNHAQIRGLYSNIDQHAFVGRSPWMIVQWFARNHPEFDFFYQWEFDVRYTGHYLDFFEAVNEFGRRQPRKGIWERAGRMYIPLVHGAYDTDFRQRTQVEDPHHIWGSVAVEGVKSRGPSPPHRQQDDNYEWGVGEDADWIGFLPSFNVTRTKWFFKDYLWGYPQGTSTPRRATVVTHGRVSRRVLDIMNFENTGNGHHIDAEMFPQTVCLHHGLKSTFFPHPIFADRYWPSEALQAVFNGGPYGQAGGFAQSTFSKWNEDAWANFTWYYNSILAKPLYQRFMGITAMDSGGAEWEEAYGRVVVRPMLLHPVKGARSWRWTRTGWHQTDRDIRA